MKARLLSVLALAVALTARADQPVRFTAMDVWFDASDHKLAAYQVEVRYDVEHIKIVGLEGGDHAAFADAPYYDRRGLTGGRIVIAAFSTADGLPTGRVRLARIHLQVEGDVVPDLQLRLMTTGDAEGRRITPGVSVLPANTEPRKEK